MYNTDFQVADAELVNTSNMVNQQQQKRANSPRILVGPVLGFFTRDIHMHSLLSLFALPFLILYLIVSMNFSRHVVLFCSLFWCVSIDIIWSICILVMENYDRHHLYQVNGQKKNCVVHKVYLFGNPRMRVTHIVILLWLPPFRFLGDDKGRASKDEGRAWLKTLMVLFWLNLLLQSPLVTVTLLYKMNTAVAYTDWSMSNLEREYVLGWLACALCSNAMPFLTEPDLEAEKCIAVSS
ncbi:hypothetical protein NC651_035734 [Populus alba x Populus x berolinensis]|nr:hypothetical protein NC651_035734 [Populus alba x Populus x berolinensis]